MTLETLRQICRALPGATEDIKWGADPAAPGLVQVHA